MTVTLHMASADRPVWLIYGGWGTDGGFGDYSPPDWDEEPLRGPDGRLMWFEDRDRAEAFARLLSRREARAFAEAGRGGEWTGDFPYEYRAFKAYIPATAPMDGDAVAEGIPVRGADA